MNVCIFGNSVTLRIRPPRSAAGEATYAERLRAHGHDVTVVARAGVLLSEAMATLEDDVVTRFPDWVIVNHGVIEVCTRQTVRWINNQTIVNYYLNAGFARPFVFGTPWDRLRSFGWRALNASIRTASGLVGARWQWLPTPLFLRALEKTLDVVLKETAARVIVLGINPCSPRVERILPGSREAIADANAAMLALASRRGPRVVFFDPASVLDATRLEELVPDGIHFSAEGHARVAAALATMLESRPGAA